MCLVTVTRVPRKIARKVHTGWKVFRSKGNQLHGLYHYSHSTPMRQKGCWLKATQISLFGSRWYPSGFHIFTSQKDAEIYRDFAWGIHTDRVVRKVQYRGVLAEGTHFVGAEDTAAGVVARWMFIPQNPRSAK